MQNIDWSILKKAVRKELSPEEQARLQDWLSESEENRLFYDRLLRFSFIATLAPVDVNKNFKLFAETVGLRSCRLVLRVMRYAAAIILLLACTGVMRYLLHNENNPLVQESVIIPGIHKALLYTGNGEQFVLEPDTDRNIRVSQNLDLLQENNTLNYNIPESKSLISEHHILRIPQGCEFSIHLSDGSQIFINSESEIEYPTVFNGTERRISFSGEGYFRIQKSDKPFIINVNGMDVRVLGTEFNLRAYSNENNYQTTLVCGKVEVSVPGNLLILAPGEQAVYHTGKALARHVVDVSKYIAWKDGIIAFEDECLVDIMTKLARWYNIEVFYTNPALKDIRFTGSINRYGDIRVLLGKIEKLDVVRFSVRGNCITVMDK